MLHSAPATAPCKPEIIYSAEWGGWKNFLGPQETKFYPTLEECIKASKTLKISSSVDYARRYSEDANLPSTPSNVYHQEWEGWAKFFGNDNERFYENIFAAAVATKKMGVRSSEAYQIEYKANPQLPSNPKNFYASDWKGWSKFLGKRGKWYLTAAEASNAVRIMGIDSQQEYKTRYKENPRLPAHPNDVYFDQWSCWQDFLGRHSANRYRTLEEAKDACRIMEITNFTDYCDCYISNPLLPERPDQFYSQEWLGWANFFCVAQHAHRYETLEHASLAVQKLDIRTWSEYLLRYKEDAMLGPSPAKYYFFEWKSIPEFLGLPETVKPYLNLNEASHGVQQLKIQSYKEYKERYREDPCLVANPNVRYKHEWIGWPGFFGLTETIKYASFHDASVATQKLGIKSIADYKKRYKTDSKLPVYPPLLYSSEWTDWYDFLGKQVPVFHKNLCDAAASTISLGIKSQTQYKKRYKEDQFLPSDPDKYYSSEWLGWRHFLGTAKEKSEPFKGFLSEVMEASPAWFSAIECYVHEGVNQQSKLSNLRQLYKQVIEPNDLGVWPGLILDRCNPFPADSYLYYINDTGESAKRNRHSVCVIFFEWLLDKYCTDEDDSGQVVRLPQYRNPLTTLMSHLPGLLPTFRPSESVKPVLPMSIILRARTHLVPPEALTLKDLAYRHRFLEDSWFEVCPSLIDRHDPDCVWRERVLDRKKNGKRYRQKVFQMWSPVKLLSLYTLISVPLRGQQICWLDSGEADEYIPILIGTQLEWVANTSNLASKNHNKGFIRQMSDGGIGMHVTTNKTARGGQGYSIPYIPQELAYWMVKLREWQTKFNTLSAPTPWLDIVVRQRINEDVLKARGFSTFLFRDPCSNTDPSGKSPINVETAFARPLSELLGIIQRPGEELAEQDGLYFKSQFTPHSLRTSMITAYIVDGGAPVHVISKLVGHHSLVMTIYYSKVGSTKMAQELASAEKVALQANVDRLKDLTLSKQIETAKPDLIAADYNFFGGLTNRWPSACYQFTDWGLCPMSGGACDTGGALMSSKGSTRIFGPVESGYLGKRNCPRCRFFVTGPAWLGGLQALANEILLEVNIVRTEYHDLEERRQSLENKKFDDETLGVRFDQSSSLNQTTAILEERAQKLDMLLCDFQSVYSLIRQCLALLNEGNASADTKQQLIISGHSELEVTLQESRSDFRLLSTICENAEMYESASSSRALPKIAQMLDRFAASNDITPGLFKLSDKQQRKAANQISALLRARLNGDWALTEQLISGDMGLSDLGPEEILRPLRGEISNAIVDSYIERIE